MILEYILFKIINFLLEIEDDEEYTLLSELLARFGELRW